MGGNRESPNVELTYRLEAHSGQVIPALCWWSLHAGRIEEDLSTNEVVRWQEGQKVSKHLAF